MVRGRLTSCIHPRFLYSYYFYLANTPTPTPTFSRILSVWVLRKLQPRAPTEGRLL